MKSFDFDLVNMRASVAGDKDGIWGQTPNLVPDSNGTPFKDGANAYFQFGSGSSAFIVGLWVTDIELEIGLNTTRAQGPTTNDVYVQNLSDVVITISCVVPNSYQKNRVANFIRYTHVQLITNHSSSQGSVKFQLRNNGQTKVHRNQKGSPTDAVVWGIINTVPFNVEKFTTAYTFQLQFSIVYTRNTDANNGAFLGLQFQPAPVQNLTNINQWFEYADKAGLIEKASGVGVAKPPAHDSMARFYAAFGGKAQYKKDLRHDTSQGATALKRKKEAAGA